MEKCPIIQLSLKYMGLRGLIYPRARKHVDRDAILNPDVAQSSFIKTNGTGGFLRSGNSPNYFTQQVPWLLHGWPLLASGHRWQGSRGGLCDLEYDPSNYAFYNTPSPVWPFEDLNKSNTDTISGSFPTRGHVTPPPSQTLGGSLS